jgi:hypothetical protein
MHCEFYARLRPASVYPSRKKGPDTMRPVFIFITVFVEPGDACNDFSAAEMQFPLTLMRSGFLFEVCMCWLTILLIILTPPKK